VRREDRPLRDQVDPLSMNEKRNLLRDALDRCAGDRRFVPVARSGASSRHDPRRRSGKPPFFEAQALFSLRDEEISHSEHTEDVADPRRS